MFPALSHPSELPGFAAHAEEIGLGSVWVVEDCFLSGGIALSATALAATSGIRVGLGLMPAAVRNPAIAAMEIATLCNLHPGRFEAAFGHGVAEWMQQIGATPQKRLGTLGETTRVVRALLAGETVSTRTTDVSLDDVTLAFPPAEPAPVLIGTVGPKALALAGRFADGIVLPEGCGPGFVEWAIAATGAPRPPRCVVYAWLSIDDDPDRARSRLRPAVDGWLAKAVYPEARRLAAELGASGDRGAVVDRVAICGDARTCAETIRRLGAAGADEVVVLPLEDDCTRQLDALATTVLPLV